MNLLRAVGRDLQTFLRATGFLVRNLVAPLRRAYLLVVVLQLTTSVLPALQPLLTKIVIDHLVARSTGPTLWWAVAGVVLALVGPAVVAPARHAAEIHLEDQAVRTLDQLIIEAGARMPDLTMLERSATHDLVSRAHDGLQSGARMPTMVPDVLSSAVALLVLAASLASVHPLVPVVLFVAALPHLVGLNRTHRLTYTWTTSTSRRAREMGYCVEVTTDPALAKEVRAFGTGRFFAERYRFRARQARAEIQRLRWRGAGFSAALSLAYVVALGGCFTYVTREVLAGRLGLGDLTLYLTASILLASSLHSVAVTLGFVGDGLRRTDDLRALLADAAPGIAVTEPGLVAPDRFAAGVELRAVGFGYPTSEAEAAAGPVLTGLDLVIPAGKVLALVGENGEGKSTLVRLLTRMHDPDTGVVLIDGRPAADYDLVSLRGRIATVFQDHARFQLTLSENIAIAVPDLLTDDPAGRAERDRRVIAAARAAGADAVADGVPQGYDQELTRVYGGVELSGGQWQKVATARAFLPDAALVILDEPTSALDADAERRLFERFGELVRGRTAVMISHRFSTVRTADVIAVLSGGRITEYGSHAELMAAGGHYAELFGLQADRYR